MTTGRPAATLIPALRVQLGQPPERHGDALTSGRRAALWRVQQQAVRPGRTLDDVRAWCLDALKPRLLDEVHENDYLRGYRDGLQAALQEIRRLETRGQGR